jgi:hypothetical protein
MTYVDEMRAAGLSVNWRTLLVGREGPGKYPPLLSLEDVRGFAETELDSVSKQSVATAAIVAASDDDAIEVDAYLRKLAEQDPSDSMRELRKWRLVLLNRAMKELPQDPLYGLLRLTEFWERFDFPGDGPHVVQSRENRTTPQEYYTEENFKRLVRKHEEWIAKEADDLRG